MANDNEIKRTPVRFDDENIEKEFDNLYRQVNQIPGLSKNRSFVFYVAETSGGTATQKLTLELNKYGIVTNMVLE